MSNKIDVLDQLYTMVGCSFLSDLKDPRWHTPLLRAVVKLDVAEYPCEQWSEAFQYVYGIETHFTSTEDICSFIETKWHKQFPYSDFHCVR